MKIGLGLVGFESKKEIARCLDPWIGHVDTFILGDGKFTFYDAPNDYSEDGWLDFAEKRYKDKVEFIGYQYAGDQITKRQRYLDLAGQAKCDFLIVADTDEYIDPQYRDWDSFYKRLRKWSTKTNDRMFYQYLFIPTVKLWPKQHNRFPSNRWLKSTRIHKDPSSMRFCCDSHYKWCDKETTDIQIYRQETEPTNGTPNHNHLMFVANHVIDGVRIRTDRTLRTPEQIKKGKEWAWLNQHSENSRSFYVRSEVLGIRPPPGFASWDEFAKKPHTFDKIKGNRIEIPL